MLDRVLAGMIIGGMTNNLFQEDQIIAVFLKEILGTVRIFKTIKSPCLCQ